jgi:hypothetical protein
MAQTARRLLKPRSPGCRFIEVKMSDILEKLKDLHRQATTENSHFYVASCCLEAINEIERLRRAVINLAIIHDARPPRK